MARDKDRDSGRTAPVRARSVREQQTSDDAFWERSNDNRAGVAEAHRRFGGLDVPATLAGMVAALGTLVVLSGIAAGAGTIGYQSGLDDTDDLSLGGFIAGMVVLFLAFLVGGWVAGRMARYDGGRNGLVSALWFVLLVAGLAALGAWAGDRYEDEFTDLDLPRWFEDNARTTTAVITGLVAVVVALLAGFLGGMRGGRYHRKADEVIAGAGGVAVARTVPTGTEAVPERPAPTRHEVGHDDGGPGAAPVLPDRAQTRPMVAGPAEGSAPTTTGSTSVHPRQQ
ncbi:MAG: TIGR04086 family membrane protein [Acidimicrobiales bacterium]